MNKCSGCTVKKRDQLKSAQYVLTTLKQTQLDIGSTVVKVCRGQQNLNVNLISHLSGRFLIWAFEYNSWPLLHPRLPKKLVFSYLPHGTLFDYLLAAQTNFRWVYYKLAQNHCRFKSHTYFQGEEFWTGGLWSVSAKKWLCWQKLSGFKTLN